MSTRNLCFGAKIRKEAYSCIPQLCYKSGVLVGEGYVLHGRFYDEKSNKDQLLQHLMCLQLE